MVLFWLIIACMYFALAITNNLVVRKQKKELRYLERTFDLLEPHPSDPKYEDSLDSFKAISVYFKKVGWINFVGFLLAAIAALYAAGILEKILEAIK